MDGFNEKKWFVYLGDHHEGPFSLAEMQTKMSQGQISSLNYVWCEGMQDWKAMTEVPAFDSIINKSVSDGTARVQDAMAGSSANNTGPMAISLVPAPADEKQVVDGDTIMASSDPKLEAATEAPENATGPILAEASSLESQGWEQQSGPSEAERAVMQQSAERQNAPQVPVPADDKTGDIDPKAAKKAAKEAEKKAKAEEKARKKREAIAMGGGERVMPKLIKLLVVVLVLGGGVTAWIQGWLDPVIKSPALKAGLQTASDFSRPYLVKAVDYVPPLGRVISPIPSLEDASEDDYEDLKQAALVKLEKEGPRAAVAVSRADPFAPHFYVSTNLPSGTSFDVFIEGVPDTLLNRLSFARKALAVTDKRLGRTETIKFPDGQGIARGEYNVYVIESEAQPQEVKALLANAQPSGIRLPPHLPKGAKVIAKKQFFLGGRKDITYQSRLKEFHEKVKARALAEMTELKQFTMTVENQFTSTVTAFGKFRKRGKGGAGMWNGFNAKWSKLDGELGQAFQKWAPETLQNEYFYGAYYEMIKQAGTAVSKVHEMHSQFFRGSTDKTSFDIQLGQVQSEAENAVSALKTRIEQAEKAPSMPSGLPRREFQ
ncbi:MAG: hypothetical protein A2583_13935 [Bdellovibrionales bacterium RIFOXYD1_FULL_53_11]|nr:MAG: hypothetical protein A2583_13935 [Bdellovibrionales bacterium RIFOXYD1_FULL_53_11]